MKISFGKIRFFHLIDVCIDLKLTTKFADYYNEFAKYISWSFGDCKSNREYQGNQEYENDQDYYQTCCFVTSPTTWVYALNCKLTWDNPNFGWSRGFITINGRRYCDDFDSGLNKTVYVEANPSKHLSCSFCLFLIQFKNFQLECL